MVTGAGLLCRAVVCAAEAATPGLFRALGCMTVGAALIYWFVFFGLASRRFGYRQLKLTPCVRIVVVPQIWEI